MKLRSLIVVTGTVHVEGGDTTKVEDLESDRGKVARKHIKKITPDRREANVITTGFMRDLRRVRILKTPFGTLIDPAKSGQLDNILAAADRSVAEFNRTSKTARLVNALIREPLEGQRRALVQGYIQRAIADGNKEVGAALPKLIAGGGA